MTICVMLVVFFFNDTATTEIYTLSLHDALPICRTTPGRCRSGWRRSPGAARKGRPLIPRTRVAGAVHRSTYTYWRSEEHTSELQSRQYLVCRLLLEKKTAPPS